MCVLTKAECPGDKRGRSGLRAHKARGRRRVAEEEGREGEGGNRLGAKWTHSAPKTLGTQEKKNLFSPPPFAFSPSPGLPLSALGVQYTDYWKFRICSQKHERRELKTTFKLLTVGFGVMSHTPKV